MDPGIRFVIVAVGALVGMALGPGGSIIWNLIIGAGLGLALGEVRALRIAIGEIQGEIEQLRRSHTVERHAAPPAARKAVPPENASEHPATPIPRIPANPQSPAPKPAPPMTLRDVQIEPRENPEPPHQPMHPPPARATAENPLVAAVRGFFTGGNTLVRVGIVVLFFGVAFLLRYAAEHSHLPIELRLSAVALGAVVLLVLGWRLRRRRAGYAFALEGGGVGILYLTVFAAFRLYNVLPQSTAFLILVLIAALAASIAILQNSQSFALLGVSGGFLAPVLASTGTGSHVQLFGYFLVLNCGIALIAWFKSWRPLNLAGFFFTFAIATAWGVLKYRPQDFSSTEPFLAAFFLLFVGVAVLYALRQPLKLRGYVDSTLVFGTPIVVFGLQTAMLHQNSMALAYSALVLSAFYLLLSVAVKRWRDPKQRPLFESFVALGVVFLTLAIPLALGNRLNSAAWALEGAGVVYIGCRQQRKLARAFGTVLIIAAAALLVPEIHSNGMHWELPWGSYAAIVLVSVACMGATWMFESVLGELNELETRYRPVLFGVGAAAWCVGSLGELPHLASGAWLLAAAIIFLAATALALSEAARRTALPFASGSSLLLLPLMCALAAASFTLFEHPSQGGGWLAWPLAFACLYLLAWRHEDQLGPMAQAALHVGALWLLCLLLAADSHWLVMTTLATQGDWATCSVLVAPALVLWFLPGLSTRTHWPFASHGNTYLGAAGAGVALVLGAACLRLNVACEGNADPLAYLPLLNPLDVAEMLTLLALFNYSRGLQRLQSAEPRSSALGASVLAALTFVWCNGVVLRTLHHLVGIPYTLQALAASNVVETTITIFWSVLALLTMLIASLRRHRATWLAGAGLLVAVIAKLFFVDLSSVGSIERIISFVGVGLLMLVVGYFSPLPPRAREHS